MRKLASRLRRVFDYLRMTANSIGAVGARSENKLAVGGGRRGVVSTACYLARIRGVRSGLVST